MTDPMCWSWGSLWHQPLEHLMMLMLMLAGLMLHPLLQGAVMMLLDQTLGLWCHHASWLQPVMTMMLCLQSLALVLPCLMTLAS
jgi:hypothetical protein